MIHTNDDGSTVNMPRHADARIRRALQAAGWMPEGTPGAQATYRPITPADPLPEDPLGEEIARLLANPPEQEACDFCLVPAVAWCYDCEDFAIPELRWRSVGGWAACEDCHQLIEAGDWAAMLTRCYAQQTFTFDDISDAERVCVRQLLADTHAMFQRLRKGPATLAEGSTK